LLKYAIRLHRANQLTASATKSVEPACIFKSAALQKKNTVEAKLQIVKNQINPAEISQPHLRLDT
jgi:hypothetical protein